ncbi:hypothetical protein [Actinomadura rayongensis]|uniref:Uncharacterized protein n=1 Tax=Actinomadura rayongensis TaxID=1429076 RepID=A0A6I4VYP6_9ACTN|nr:hypothetical protein [Actinomadura rayongensis]MXQ63097.1 hypothetical protein [Actinomadura rayongensis]
MPSVDLDEQKALDVALGGLVLRELSEDDGVAHLTIEIGRSGLPCVTVTSGTRPLMLPSDELLEAACRLADAHERAGTGLTGAAYRFEKQPSGRWSMAGDFTYAG